MLYNLYKYLVFQCGIILCKYTEHTTLVACNYSTDLVILGVFKYFYGSQPYVKDLMTHLKAILTGRIQRQKLVFVRGSNGK